MGTDAELPSAEIATWLKTGALLSRSAEPPVGLPTPRPTPNENPSTAIVFSYPAAVTSPWIVPYFRYRLARAGTAAQIVTPRIRVETAQYRDRPNRICVLLPN